MAAVLLALMLCIGWSSPALADHVKDGRTVHRIVFQVNEDNPQLWNLMLNNIGNIIGAMGKDHVDIKVVAYGPGIDLYPGIVRIVELQEKGYVYLRP